MSSRPRADVKEPSYTTLVKKENKINTIRCTWTATVLRTQSIEECQKGPVINSNNNYRIFYLSPQLLFLLIIVRCTLLVLEHLLSIQYLYWMLNQTFIECIYLCIEEILIYWNVIWLITKMNNFLRQRIFKCLFFYILMYYSLFYTTAETKILSLNLVTVVKWLSTKKTCLYTILLFNIANIQSLNIWSFCILFNCFWFVFVDSVCRFSLYVLLVIRSTNLSSSPCLAQKFEFRSLPRVEPWPLPTLQPVWKPIALLKYTLYCWNAFFFYLQRFSLSKWCSCFESVKKLFWHSSPVAVATIADLTT